MPIINSFIHSLINLKTKMNSPGHEGSAVNISSRELVARHLIRYDNAAHRPAIRTGLIEAQLKAAPASRILIIPVSKAVRNATKIPRKRSLLLRVINFDFILTVF